ncbi:MAG: TonB-dependent receptor [Lewinellaceae bacterium]|nr:TonB-dependent receptor [Lewinellaceae bacterium]
MNSSLTFEQISVLPEYQNRYGGGADLLPFGYNDNTGFYKVPIELYNEDGSVSASYQSFDLVPIYGVDESNGTRFATSTDQHFQHLAGFAYDNGQAQYGFPSGYGAGQSNLFYRNWNSWDDWDTANFGQSIPWQAGDNPGDFFQTGVTSNQNIALDGGGERSAFRLSYNRYDQKGIYPNSHQERNSLGFNGSLDMSKHLVASVGINYVNTRTLGRSAVGYDARGGLNSAQNFNQWWHTQLRFDDLKQYQNPNGTQRTWNRRGPNDPNPQYWDNPYWVRYKNYQNDGRDRFFGNVGLTWKINNWLSLSGRVLQDYYSEFREERIAVGSISPSKYSLDQYNVGETNTDLILRAERTIGEAFSYGAFVGGNKLWRKTNRHVGVTRGGLNVPDIYTLQNSLERPFVQTTVSEKQIESVFGGLSLGWQSTLFLDLTGRQDWSSTLPEANNGYFYPSASLSYVFSEMIKIPAMSFGKLRLGWAKVGNDTDPYNILTTYTPRDNFGNAPVFTVPNTLNNRSLLPEATSTIEAGADLRFFSNRLGLDLSVYSGKTVNQIIPLSTTPATGYNFQFINAGEISNKGIEIALNATPVQTQNFSWDIGFNFGKNVNKIVDLNPEDPDLVSLPITSLVFLGALVAYEGQPFGTITGTNYLYDKNGNKLIDPNSGFYLASETVMPIGNITPDFTGGVTNTWRWKGLSLTAFIDFRKGGDIVSTTNLFGRYSGLLAETAVGDARENGVVNPGVTALVDGDGVPVLENAGDPNTPLDDVYASSGTANTVVVGDQLNRILSGGFGVTAADVYDGSFIKLRELSIGYTFPKQWLQRVRLQDLHLALVGRNLAILHKNIPHLDPDNAISTSNIQGSEGGQVPAVRSVGVNLSFRF